MTEATIDTGKVSGPTFSLKGSLLECVAVLAALVGVIVYVITSTTGYLAGSGMSIWPLSLTIVAMIAIACEVIFLPQGKATTAGPGRGVLADVLVMVGEVLLVVSFAMFVLARVSLAADIYFIPVNYPHSEVTALNISVVGVLFYLVAIIALIIRACRKDHGDLR
ncbi:hypothetical protein OZX73_00135 [Bifidobacterium sp. ESL0775]|uniref:hypothetical protein n=1 Tax=Bifidobacterium sp. ESL0775 TaxID=2983230 RepID=UPI0023F6577F|nr:hypothetical protein [Bifidobacterium sp. ESL0775]WEV69353.1 hypothetical protein OZX73_00135 [Bifidobacterium sp. ESL0775]